MTQNPPCGPESNDLFRQAQEQVQAIQKLTQEIQLQTQLPHLPTLTQLILKRDGAIRTLIQLDLQILPEALQIDLANALAACQGLDPEIEERLKQIRNRLEGQIRGIQSGKTLIGKYKIDNPKSSGQYSKDA